MTGVLAKVVVAAGDRVAEGDELFVVEAMKMEFSVKAPRAAVVTEVKGARGAKVALGEVVVVFEGEA
jgi:biotin carboxyl carrier protein